MWRSIQQDTKVERARLRVWKHKWTWLGYIEHWRGKPEAGYYAFTWNWRQRRKSKQA